MTLPAPVLSVLQGICSKALPNGPNTAAQGSERMVPGDWPWEAAFDNGYFLNFDAFFDQWEWEEENWRHLSTGGPAAKVAYDFATSAQIVNAQGKSPPITVADDMHFSLTQHLGISKLRGSPLSIAHVSALMDWSVKWAKEKCPTVESLRALGWMLEGAARVAAANKKAGVKDDRPLFVAKAIVKRLKATSGEQNGCPYLGLNGPSAGQADHGYCRVSVWMQSRITYALALWLDQAPWWTDIPFTWWSSVKGLYMQGLKAQRWAMEQSEKVVAPLGGCCDDYDPHQPDEIAPLSAGLTFTVQSNPTLTMTAAPCLFVHQKDGKPLWDGTMSLFAMPAMLTAKRHAPVMWEEFYKPRARAWWERSERMKWKPSMGVHEASVALQIGPVFGYKT